MWTKAYKVLLWDLKSVSGSRKYTVVYKPRELHKPLIDTLGLFVFDTIENARKFNKGVIGRIICECLVENARHINTIGEPGCINEFYAGNKQNYKFVAPEGTMVCDSLILLEEVGAIKEDEKPTVTPLQVGNIVKFGGDWAKSYAMVTDVGLVLLYDEDPKDAWVGCVLRYDHSSLESLSEAIFKVHGEDVSCEIVKSVTI